MSRDSSAFTVTPSVVASRITTSSPATTTSTSASGAPRTAGLSPVTTRSEPTTRLPDNPSAATFVPSVSPGSSSARSESGAHRSITSEAATVGRNGPGHNSWPWASSTTASSASPKPDPPCSSPMASPNHPNSAAAFHTSSGWEDPPSSVARAPARVDSRVNWPIAASARSWCSSVMASADLLTLEVLFAVDGCHREVNRHSRSPEAVTGITSCPPACDW